MIWQDVAIAGWALIWCAIACYWRTRATRLRSEIRRLRQLESPGLGGPLALRPVVREFAAGMEAKLRMNDHKPHWRTCSLEYLRARLSQEVAELDGALEDGDPRLVRGEAVDVANFAMMLADVAAMRALEALRDPEAQRKYLPEV